MVHRVVILRPRESQKDAKNGQSRRVDTLHKIFVGAGYKVQVKYVRRIPNLKDYRLISNLVSDSQTVLAITSFILLPWCISPLGYRKIRIVDMMDSLIKTRGFSFENLSRWMLGRFEILLSLIFRSNHIRTYISEYDRDSDKNITPKNVKTFLIPNTVSAIKFNESTALERLVFVGDLNYSENRKMLRDLCTVLESTGMKLHIYGIGKYAFKFGSKHCIFHGVCDDAELYRAGDLHLAPVRNRHGLSNKVFGPVINGVPVLTTDCGTNGIKECSGIYVENDISKWPQMISNLFQQSRNLPFKIQWSGFKNDEIMAFSSTLLELLTPQDN